MNVAAALIRRAGPFTRLLADRGYDARHIRDLLAERGAEAVIPSTRSRRIPIPHDTHAYRQRNLAERLWCRLKDWRRLATRYDKLSANFLSTALIAATITYWAN
jgi:transposase